jgi:uncharacterized Fe-S cluster protein YjdI
MKIKKEYTHGDLTVVWQPHLCVHSAICFRSLPQVFRPRERPWIHMSESDAKSIIDTVHACPSGALSLKHVEVEEVRVVTESGLSPKIHVAKNGPLRIKEPCQVILPDGTVVDKPNGVSLCRCGGSSEKPFCDGAHKVNGFIG